MRVKKFLSQFQCMIKFLFLEGMQRHVFTINCQGFIILACIGAELEFFYLWFLGNFGFFDSKKFFTLLHCKIKFLFLEGIQGHISTIIHQCFTILSVSGRELEIFYLWFLEKLGIFESKKFFTRFHYKIKFLFLGRW